MAQNEGNEGGEHVGMTFRGGAMAGGCRSSPIRRFGAAIATREGWVSSMAHRKSDGGGRGIRGALEVADDVR